MTPIAPPPHPSEPRPNLELVFRHNLEQDEALDRFALPLLERLARGESVAFVSDAGTPAVSDPGAVLVAAVVAAGRRVVPLPGPSSALAALSVAGDARSTGFRMAGFLPSKGAERAARLQAWLADEMAVVVLEAPHRIETLADELARRAPDRPVTLARELTKQFESIVTLPAGELPAWLAADANRRRGEFTLVVHAPPPRAAGAEAELPAEARHALAVLQRELPLKQAVALAAGSLGLSKAMAMASCGANSFCCTSCSASSSG